MISPLVAPARNASGRLVSYGPNSVVDSFADLPAKSQEAATNAGLRLQSLVQIVSGDERILALKDLLLAFATRCGQDGAMEDIRYFLSKPGFLKRVPRLMLIAKNGELTPENLLGALLLFEYHVAGRGTGLYTTNDRSGRNTLVAPAHLRSEIAHLATQTLLNRGAHVVMMTFREDAEQAATSLPALATGRMARWATRQRNIAEYLPLERTYDATLARIGQRTRSNMRYYRRRAEKELGCTFVPFVEITKADFLDFNRTCMFAVSDAVAAWRYDALHELTRPLLMGMRDRDGRWLSLVGARRFRAGSELLWQMNRDGMPLYSLSLVMRSYVMEHEIAAGSQRFYIEGGTSHPIHLSFTTERLTDLTARRSSVMAFAVRKLARHVIPSDNQLARMFSDTDLVWRRSGRQESS